MDDVIQTLIDLRLAHTGGQQDVRDNRFRRRHKGVQCDDNNNTLNSK